MSDALRQQYQTALQLQQRRCEAYHTWKENFNSALAGSAAASDLDRVIQTVVLKTFQEVSAGLRQLQTTVAEHLKTDTAGAASASLAGSRAFLIRWIDRLQETEKTHYEVSVQLASALAAHTTPNVVPLYARQAAADAAAAERATQREAAKLAARRHEEAKELEAQTQHAHAHAGSGCASEAHAQPAAASVAVITTSAPAPPALEPSVSVHDDLLCPLTHALPSHERGGLFFVHCSGAVDLLGNDSEQEEEEAEERGHDPTSASAEEEAAGPEDAEDDEDDPVIKAGLGEVALADRAERVLAYYAPRAVALRCLKAERVCGHLRAQNHQLEEKASELYEELQCEFSDL